MEEKNLKKCAFCGKEMKPFVDEEGGQPLLIGLKCDYCGATGPKIMFDNSMIDEKKFMEEYTDWLERLC